MLELTDKRLVSVLWMLKNKGKKWSISELRRGAVNAVYKKNTRFPIMDLSLTYGPTFSFVKELEKSGFIAKDITTNEYAISKASGLVEFVSRARSFNSLKKIEYYSPIEFTGTLKMIADAKLDYAFTIFAGSELYKPYVKTDQVHVYIRDGEELKWQKYLLSKKCLKAEKGQANTFLIPTKQEVFFREAAKVKKFSVAPTPILLSDLFGFGGLAEEQARFLMNEWLDNRL